VSIEALFDAAHAANVVHFPNTFTIARHSGQWTATLTKADEPASGKTPHGRGMTPEEAIEAACKHVADALQSNVERAERAASEARANLSKIGTLIITRKD
jgi:hypothetical protein